MSYTQEEMEEVRRILGIVPGHGMHCISFQGKDPEGNEFFVEALVEDNPLPAKGDEQSLPSESVPDQTSPRLDMNAQH